MINSAMEMNSDVGKSSIFQTLTFGILFFFFSGWVRYKNNTYPSQIENKNVNIQP